MSGKLQSCSKGAGRLLEERQVPSGARAGLHTPLCFHVARESCWNSDFWALPVSLLKGKPGSGYWGSLHGCSSTIQMPTKRNQIIPWRPGKTKTNFKWINSFKERVHIIRFEMGLKIYISQTKLPDETTIWGSRLKKYIFFQGWISDFPLIVFPMGFSLFSVKTLWLRHTKSMMGQLIDWLIKYYEPGTVGTGDQSMKKYSQADLTPREGGGQ